MRAGVLVGVLAAVLLTACAGASTTEIAAEPGATASPTPCDRCEAIPRVPLLHPNVDGFPSAVVHLLHPEEDRVRVDVRVAETPAQRRQGLMHVPRLPDKVGMLFVYDGERRGSFWMKDTLVPLDIAFFDGEGVLVAILQMDPCEEDRCPTYDPGVAYATALEVRQSWLAEQGVTEGWAIRVLRPGG